MDRSTVATTLLVLLGLALAAFPVAAPATDPPDRVEYGVERVDGDVGSWETLAYENLSASTRERFDAALASDDGTDNVSVANGESLPPLADPVRPVVAYDLRYEGAWYLLQVTHFDPEVPTRAYLVRLAALLAGLAMVVVGGYRAVVG